ncbi:MAG TPA: hypothetical protein VGN90_00610 [Pyrinomonadaceae bacterium]|nr:hypothetical protein [Pyrinomonadaceae bacterium]
MSGSKNNLRLVAGVLVLLAMCVAVLVLTADSRLGGQVAFAQGSGDPDPSEYAGGEGGDSCEVDPCGGDPCCGDPCCGDPCCGDPCCGDPCCGDYCCQYPGDPSCQDCYEVCETVCGDNEDCLDWDEYTHTCWLWGDEVCWQECHQECY